MNTKMLRSRTVWTGIAAIVAAAGGYFTGSMDMGTAIQTGVGGLMGIFLRMGIEGK